MSSADPPFIRPLLDFSKYELKHFLQEEGLKWREDASNQDSKYLRNRVRNELLPLLRELSRDGIENRIRDLDAQSRLLEKDLEFRYENWSRGAETGSGLLISGIESEPEFLKREILVRFITAKTGIALSYQQLEKIIALINDSQNQWSFHLESNWIILRKEWKLFCEKKMDC